MIGKLFRKLWPKITEADKEAIERSAMMFLVDGKAVSRDHAEQMAVDEWYTRSVALSRSLTRAVQILARYVSEDKL